LQVAYGNDKATKSGAAWDLNRGVDGLLRNDKSGAQRGVDCGA